MENFREMPDVVLLRRMEALAADERKAISSSLACLREIDRRKAFADLGYPDLFEYCVGHLKYPEGCAYRRIRCLVAAEARPEIYDDLESGAISLTTLGMVASEVAGPGGSAVLAAIRGKRKRQVEEWIASRQPATSPVPDRVKVMPPAPPPSPESGIELSFDVPSPPPPIPTYQYSFVASAALHKSIERLRDLLWNKMPFGHLDDFLQEAVRDYLERHDPELKLKTNRAPVKAARPTNARRVPDKVRNQVWARDGGRCTFVSPGGVRCPCRRGLELDHITPFSVGGRSDDPANVRLLCREHNQLERRKKLGEGGN